MRELCRLRLGSACCIIHVTDGVLSGHMCKFAREIIFMRFIQSFDELNIPNDYKEYLSEYLHNLSNISFISRVILFGSCAREEVREYSDIDIFITADRKVTHEDEFIITCECRPPHSMKSIPLDIIIQDEDTFAERLDSFGMIQKQVRSDGVDLSGVLRQCVGNGTIGHRFV